MQDQKFFVVGINGSGLFDPYAHDLHPLPRITSCWRGYVCTYKTLYNKLLLDQFQVNLGHEGPPINNIQPRFDPKNIFDNIYNALDLHMDFTGGLLVASGFISQLYVHMGFHPAWKYETVCELIFSQGHALDTRDVSEKMAELRDKMIHQPLQPGADVSKQELDLWIAATFKMDYRL